MLKKLLNSIYDITDRLREMRTRRKEVDGTDLHARPAIHRSRPPTYWATLPQKNEKPRREIENPDRNFGTKGPSFLSCPSAVQS